MRSIFAFILVIHVQAISESSLIRRGELWASADLERLAGGLADSDATVIAESLMSAGGVSDEMRSKLKLSHSNLKASLLKKKQRVWGDALKDSMDALRQCVMNYEKRSEGNITGESSQEAMLSQLYAIAKDHRGCRVMEDEAHTSVSGCEYALRKEQDDAKKCSLGLDGQGHGDCIDLLLKVTSREEECKSFKEDHKQLRERCHTAQALLETHACELSKKNKVCEEYLQCQAKNTPAFKEAKKVIKKEEAKLIPETRAVEQIECILQAGRFSVTECGGAAAPAMKIFTAMSVDDKGRVTPEETMLMAEDLRFPEPPRSRACEAWQGEEHLLEGFYAGLPKGAPLKPCASTCCQGKSPQAVLLQEDFGSFGPSGFVNGIPVYAKTRQERMASPSLSESATVAKHHLPMSQPLLNTAGSEIMDFETLESVIGSFSKEAEAKETDNSHAQSHISPSSDDPAAPAKAPAEEKVARPAAPAPCPAPAKAPAEERVARPAAPAPCPSPHANAAKATVAPAPCPSRNTTTTTAEPTRVLAPTQPSPAPCPTVNTTTPCPTVTTTTPCPTTTTTATTTTTPCPTTTETTTTSTVTMTTTTSTEETTVTETTSTLTTITETETETTTQTLTSTATTVTTTSTETTTTTRTETSTTATRTSTTILTETTTSTTTAEPTTTSKPVTWQNFGAGTAAVIGNDQPCLGGHGRQNWIIKLPDNWTDDKIKYLAQQFPSEDRFVGTPSKKGLPILIIWANQEELSVALHTVPGAEYVEVDSGISAVKEDFNAEFEPDDGKPDPVPWGLDRIDNEGELDGRYTAGGPDGGRGIHVYVFNSGIRTTHGQFGGRAIPTLEVKSGKVVPCSSTDVDCAVDNHGHGTHQAGVIGGGTVGVAQGSWLHAVKILSDTGQGTLSSFLMAADWLLVNANRPAVVNLALSAEVHTGDARILKDVIDRMVARDIPVIVPAGQENDNACFYSPSDVTAAITVGASGPDDKRAAFSSFGTCVDLFAPGSKVVTAGIRSDRSYAVLSSTALAASHVTGAVAMFLALANGTAAQDEVEKEIVRAAFAGLLKNVQDSPNKLLGIRWSALKPVLIGQSEPHAPPPGQAKKDFRKKCVRAPSAGLLCPSNAGDYGQRLGFDRFRDQFHITVEGNQVCAQRYDQEEDDFLPSTKYSASSFDEGGWTINLVVLCHQKLLAKTDKWLFTRLGDPGEPSVCAGSNPTDRSKLYYVAYEDVTQEADCKKLCQLRYGCKAFSLNGKTCEVWLKDAKSFLRLPKDYPTDNSVSCNRFIGRGSAGSGSLRLAAAPTKCLQVENDILKVTTCAHEETQQFTWDGVGPITLTGKSGQCLTLTNKSAPVKMDACSADGPVPSQTFAFEGTGTISWMDIITHDKLCLATNGDGPMKISPCDIKSPSMQFFY